MKEHITISRNDFLQTLYLLEKLLYIVHRAENREDADNRAYAMAITFAKENVQEELNTQRMNLFSYLTKAEIDEIEPLLDSIDYKLPYVRPLAELREELCPFLVRFIPLEEGKDHV